MRGVREIGPAGVRDEHECRRTPHPPLVPDPCPSPPPQYVVSVVGKLPDGTTTPASNTLTFTTPQDGCAPCWLSACCLLRRAAQGCCARKQTSPPPCLAAPPPDVTRSGPAITDARAAGPSDADVVLTPPPGTLPDSYTVVLCPRPAGSAPCVTQTCPTASCPVSGLQPGTGYDVTATASVDGVDTPASNSATLTTPAADAPVLTAADDTSSSTGFAEGAAPPGAAFTQYTFAARPLAGGAVVVIISATPSVVFTGLLPATQYEVSLVGTLPDGSSVPAPNTISFVTPADG